MSALELLLALYHEGRACRRLTARRVIDLFEDVQRHELRTGRGPAEVFGTDLTRLQRQILRLPGCREPTAVDSARHRELEDMQPEMCRK